MPVTSGKVTPVRRLLLTGVLMVAVFPGLGVLIVPLAFAGRANWGALVWMVAWASPTLLLYLMERMHEVDGDRLTTRTHRSMRVRSLADVVSVAPAPLFLPAAVARFDDGSKAWMLAQNGFLDEALTEVPSHSVSLPHGNWVRRRRIVWFVALFAAGLTADG